MLNLERNTGAAARSQAIGTGLGVLAIIMWSTSVAFSRMLAERLGTFTAGSSVQLLGGIAGILFFLAARRRGTVIRMSWPFMLAIALVAFYLVALYMAIGFSASRTQVLEVGLINYLWPSIMLVSSLPILHKRATPWLVPGIILALAGTVLVALPGQALQQPGAGMRRHWLPYVLVLGAAFAWGIYSTLVRRWATRITGAVTPLAIFLAGLLLVISRGFAVETSHVDLFTLGLLIFMALGPTMLAYQCWEHAMRTGRVVLLASLSFFIPLISTLVSSLVLRVMPDPRIWLACALLIAGAVICNRAVRDT